MEMDTVGSGQKDLTGLAAPRGRGVAVRATKCAGKSLVRGVPGLEGNFENAELALEQPEGCALEQDPALQMGGGLAAGRTDYAIQLRPG
jgi:hypothetical protein